MAHHRSAVLGASAAFRGTQNMALTSIALLLHDELHADAASIGLVGALAGAAGVVANFGVASRLRPSMLRSAVIVAAFVLLGGLVVMGLAPNLAVAAAGALLVGVAGGLGMPSLTGLSQLLARDASRRERQLAVFTLVLSASLAVAPLIEGGVLALSDQNVRLTYLVFGLMPLVVAGALVSVRPVHDEPLELRREQPSAAGGHPLRLPGPRIALIAQLMYALPFAAVTAFGAAMARSLPGVSAATAQYAFTSFFVASLAARALVAARSPIANKTRVLVLAGVATVAGVALATVAPTYLTFILAMALLGVPHGVIFPVALSVLAESVEPAALPKANSYLIGGSNVVAVAAPAMLGSLATAVGYRGMEAFVLAPTLALVAALGWARRHATSSEHVGLAHER